MSLIAFARPKLDPGRFRGPRHAVKQSNTPDSRLCEEARLAGGCSGGELHPRCGETKSKARFFSPHWPRVGYAEVRVPGAFICQNGNGIAASLWHSSTPSPLLILARLMSQRRRALKAWLSASSLASSLLLMVSLPAWLSKCGRDRFILRASSKRIWRALLWRVLDTAQHPSQLLGPRISGPLMRDRTAFEQAELAV